MSDPGLLSKRFRARVDSLFSSQQSRSREKRDKNQRIIRHGYVLPFDLHRFREWFLKQFGGNENGVCRCKWCFTVLDAYSCTVDHVIPLSRNGSPGLDNCTLTCQPCNYEKGRMDGEEYEWFRSAMRDMTMKFGPTAPADISSRLQKAVQLAASVRWSMAKKAKRQAPADVGGFAEEEF